MSKVTKETLKEAFKPFDIVSIKGNVGYIKEVSINEGQDPAIVSYSITWLVREGEGTYNSWHGSKGLVKHCNLFTKIAEDMCHPFGTNKQFVNQLLKIEF